MVDTDNNKQYLKLSTYDFADEDEDDDISRLFQLTHIFLWNANVYKLCIFIVYFNPTGKTKFVTLGKIR